MVSDPRGAARSLGPKPKTPAGILNLGAFGAPATYDR
jgi:hypothetical protein